MADIAPSLKPSKLTAWSSFPMTLPLPSVIVYTAFFIPLPASDTSSVNTTFWLCHPSLFSLLSPVSSASGFVVSTFIVFEAVRIFPAASCVVVVTASAPQSYIGLSDFFITIVPCTFLFPFLKSLSSTGLSAPPIIVPSGAVMVYVTDSIPLVASYAVVLNVMSPLYHPASFASVSVSMSASGSVVSMLVFFTISVVLSAMSVMHTVMTRSLQSNLWSSAGRTIFPAALLFPAAKPSS